MRILIADDEYAVRRNFELAIRRLGHTPVLCGTLASAANTIRSVSTPLDIAFLDNHFPDEGYGIERIREFCQLRPEMDVIVTTERSVDPGLVKEILDLQVGFFKKNTVDPDLLDAEVTQRVNSRKSKVDAIRAKVLALQKDLEAGTEGISRFFRFFDSRKKLIIESMTPTDERLVVPHFERFQTVHLGQTIEISEEVEVSWSAELKAATAMEFGMGLHESAKFFGTSVGLRIKEKLQADFGFSDRQTFKSTLKKGQSLALTTADESAGIRKREFYRGIEHQVYRVAIRTACSKCKLEEVIVLKLFVPINFVEVTVSFDMKGFIAAGQDGRLGYRQLRD